MTESIAPEICTKILRNWSENLRARFPLTTLRYTMLKIFSVDDAFLKILEVEESLEEGQQLQQ